MDNQKPQQEKYQKVLLVLASVFLLSGLGLLVVWMFNVDAFPIFLAFVPHFIADILAAVASWKSKRRLSFVIFLTVPVLVLCAVFFQLSI